MIYQLIRDLMFTLESEKAHHLALTCLNGLERSGLMPFIYPKHRSTPITVMGLTFSNRVGLAAGLDKNGDYIDALSALGFGFIEIGTVTPRPQGGNPKPRLFRVPQAQAIINRMGFNNLGVDHLVEQVQRAHTDAIIGINIGKNADTPVEKAIDDYVIGLQKVYAYADYVTINISSPNTPGLRTLQFGQSLSELLDTLKNQQMKLHQIYKRYVPMAVKVAPDLEPEQVSQLAQTFAEYEIDAIIATNTTMSRQGVENLPSGKESGGLSGQPLLQQSTNIVRQFKQELPQHLPIIAVGGIMSGDDAVEKLDAGASLIQLYSGLIYQGPSLVGDIIKTIEKRNK